MRFYAVLLAVLWTARLSCAGEADALAISANIQARHLPFGTILDPMYASPESDELIGYTRCGDSAIWTGHYLAAEAFRYKVTGSPEALFAVNYAIDSLRRMVDVVGTGLLPRCIVPIDSPYAPGILAEEAPHGNGIGNAEERGWFWIGNTSRDQYSGVFFGLAVAWEMVDDENVRNSIRALVTQLLDFLLDHHWIIRMPNGDASTTFIGRADQELSFLRVGRRVNPNRFSSTYRNNAPFLAPTVLPPVGIDVLDDHEAYFKFNLDVINLYNLVRLEENGFYRPFYTKAYDVLRRAIDDHQNAHFNMIDRALRGPDAHRDLETVALLEAWLQRPRRDPWVDLRSEYAQCGDPDRACSVIPVEQRVTTDFVWQRSPFQLYGGGGGVIETAGIDYILPYWMARYYGILQN